MEENYIMSTSVMQYLEDIRSYMRESHATRGDDKLELLSTDQIADEDNFRAIEFEQFNNDEVQRFNHIEWNTNEQLSWFANKVSSFSHF